MESRPVRLRVTSYSAAVVDACKVANGKATGLERVIATLQNHFNRWKMSCQIISTHQNPQNLDTTGRYLDFIPTELRIRATANKDVMAFDVSDRLQLETVKLETSCAQLTIH